MAAVKINFLILEPGRRKINCHKTTSHKSSIFNIYFVAENLILRARSEKIGYAVNQHSGMMEYWSVGIMVLAEWDLIF